MHTSLAAGKVAMGFACTLRSVACVLYYRRQTNSLIQCTVTVSSISAHYLELPVLVPLFACLYFFFFFGAARVLCCPVNRGGGGEHALAQCAFPSSSLYLCS